MIGGLEDNVNLCSDESTVPSYLLQIFERVRHSADFMPTHQVHKQMAHELGDNWRDHFKEFEDKPFAAASIGQVLLCRTCSFTCTKFRFTEESP